MDSIFSGADIFTAIVAIATSAGGYVTGRRMSNAEAMEIATETVDMLQAQIESLKDDKELRDQELLSLRTRVGVLEGLITQRADVESVHEDIKAGRVILDRIADRIGA